MYTFSFEKLEVWNLARDLIKVIYSVTKDFPEAEKFGLTGQIRRAAVSVANNLAEGSSRKSFKEKANFTTTAFSSLMEVLNLLIICKDLEILHENEYLRIRPLVEEISNKLNALRNSQTSSKTNN